MNPVPEFAGIQLDRLEEFAPRCLPDSGHIFHNEYRWFEEFHIVKVILVKEPPRVLDKPIATIRTVDLSHPAESLAGWPSDNHVDLLFAYQLPQLFGLECRQISFENMRDIRKISLKDLDGLTVDIYGGDALQSGPFKSQTEAAATAEKI
jgi:hypothetical protein